MHYLSGLLEKLILKSHGQNFTAVRTSNQGIVVDMLTQLLTLAVTERLFGLAGVRDFFFDYLGSCMEGFRSSKKFNDHETAMVCSFSKGP